MKKVKFIGEDEKILPTLGITVKPGDELDVPDDFANALFVSVEDSRKKGDK